MKKPLYIIFVTLAIGFIASCQSPNSSSSTDLGSSQKNVLREIEKPFVKVVPVKNVFKIPTSKPDTLRLENGTTMYIPENAFVDNKNQSVKGEVQLDYIEFHNAADIIVSGIPMKWDNAGTIVDFQTAGMMEIRAYQNNEELNLAEGKSITVDMASQVKGEDYGAYYFDEKINNWTCLKANPVKENTYKQSQLVNLEKTEVFMGTKPDAYNPDAYTFDLDINYSTFPELKDLNGVMWQYAGTSANEDPRLVTDFKLKKWKNIQIDRIEGGNNEFRLRLTDIKNKLFSTIVKPVLSGKMLAVAQKKFEEKFKAYEEKLAFKKAEKERLQKQADLLRTFQVQNMGIYNYDRQLKLEDRVELFVDFDFGGNMDKDINNVEVFLITGNGNAVVHYPKSDWHLFAFSPSADNKLVAVLPNDKVAIFSQKDFNALNLSKFKKGERSTFTFKMKYLDAVVKNPEELNKVIASI